MLLEPYLAIKDKSHESFWHSKFNEITKSHTFLFSQLLAIRSVRNWSRVRLLSYFSRTIRSTVIVDNCIMCTFKTPYRQSYYIHTVIHLIYIIPCRQRYHQSFRGTKGSGYLCVRCDHIASSAAYSFHPMRGMRLRLWLVWCQKDKLNGKSLGAPAGRPEAGSWVVLCRTLLELGETYIEITRNRFMKHFKSHPARSLIKVRNELGTA